MNVPLTLLSRLLSDLLGLCSFQNYLMESDMHCTMEDNPRKVRCICNGESNSWITNPQRPLTVEIIILLYASGILLEIPVIQQYLYYKAREELKVAEVNENDTICNPSYQNSSDYR